MSCANRHGSGFSVVRALLVISMQVAWLVAALVPASAQSSSAADVPRLLTQDIVVTVIPIAAGNGGRITATLDIPVPQQRLWAVMLDCRSSLRILENLKSCKVTAADPGGKWDEREHIVHWGWPLPSVRSVFRSDYIPFERISFQRTAGDLKALQGMWRLERLPVGRGTRLSYEAAVDPGVPLPGFLIRNAIETDVRKTLSELRKEATKHDGT